MPRKDYPYLNTSLDSLNGEEWEDIPALDGYFLISNFGRIKRQRYEMQYKNGAIYSKPEKIIKPYILKAPNKFKKDYACFLVARVTVAGKRYNISVARMVHYCFVERFDLEDLSIVVICKDTDNFNIWPSNLQTATIRQKQQRTIARKRFRSPFLDLSDQLRQKQRTAILKAIGRQVTQYTLKGKRVRTYASAAAAERHTGIFATAIRTVASGEDCSAGGFIWQWGKRDKIDVAALKQERRRAYVRKYGQKVTQYDLSGRRIAQFACIKDASLASGVHTNAINKVLQGAYKSTKGYFWKKGYSKNNIDLSDHKWGRASMALTQSKPVKQYSLKGKYIKTFPSIKLAAQAVGLHSTSIVDNLKGRQQSSGGFRWKYA